MNTINAIKSKLGILYLKKYRSQLARNPLDSSIHYELSKASIRFGLYNLAHAELRSAEYLGLNPEHVTGPDKKIRMFLTELSELDVNQYQRFSILQSHLNELLDDGDSILDIGGGHGILSQFMPDNRYFLVEPSTNGISGLRLPFPDNSFDAVVTCHVLEHIVETERPLFIDELMRVANKSVLIFNPFKSNVLDDLGRMQLILDITKAAWVKEHIDCGLPDLVETTDYLSSKDISFNVREYGDMYTSVATFLMSFFAKKINKSDLLKINRHLNTDYDQTQGGKYPTNIMIEIKKT